MPQYSRTQLEAISHALREKGYDGMSNEVWWWNEHTRRVYREHVGYRAMYRPLKEMPLFIEDEIESNRIIAEVRLKGRR
jgi:hypothetical protein